MTILSLSEAPEIDAKVTDGAAITNMFRPTYGKTFRDYVINTFVPYISSLLRTSGFSMGYGIGDSNLHPLSS